MGIATGNRELIKKTETHSAGEALSTGDVVELRGNQLFKITPRPKFTEGTGLELDSGYVDHNKTVSVIRPNLLATFTRDNNMDPNVQSIYFDGITVRSLQTGYVFTNTNIDEWISIVTLNPNKVICAWTDSANAAGYVEVSPLEDLRLTANGTLYTFATYVLNHTIYDPDILAISESKAVIMYTDKTSTGLTEVKLTVIGIDDDMTISTGVGPFYNATIHITSEAVDYYGNRILWLGGDQYVASFRDVSSTAQIFVPVIISDAGIIIGRGAYHAVDWEGTYTGHYLQNVIQIGNNRILFLEAYAYGGSTTDRRISVTVLEVNGGTITQLGTTHDLDGIIPDTLQNGIGIGHICENHVLMMYYHNLIDDSYATILKVEDDYTVTVVSDTKFDTNICYAVNTHICRVDQNLFANTWVGADTDTWIRMSRVDDPSQDNILGVVLESVSEGDDCEVVTQGKIKQSILTKGETGYCSAEGDIVNYMPINYESRHPEGCFFTPRRVEIGKQKTDTIFEVNIKHSGGQSGIS